MRPVSHIIIHCSATPEGRDVTAATIRQWHKAKGWRDIGYHYIIRLDGTIEQGRPLDQPGAHCTGHNADSIGICYIGGLAADCKTPKDTRTADQKASLISLIKQLLQQFPTATIHGHNEFAAKACPSFNVQEWRKEVEL